MPAIGPIARLQRAVGNRVVQRTLFSATAAGDTTSPLRVVLAAGLESPHQSLYGEALSLMEHSFGRSFGDVRIHTDSASSESAVAVGAAAYTVGRDIVFGPGQYVPDSVEGRRLIAHELTHVIQQGGGSLSDVEVLTIGKRSDPLEREAEESAARVVTDSAERSSTAREAGAKYAGAAAVDAATTGPVVAPHVQRESHEGEGSVGDTLQDLFSMMHAGVEFPHAAVSRAVIEAGEAGAPIFPKLANLIGAGELSAKAGQGLYAAGEAMHHSPFGILGKLMAPVGLMTGAHDVFKNLSKEHVTLEHTGNALSGGLEAISGALGTAELLGLEVAGGSLAPLAGAAAGGYALGKMIEEHTHIGDKLGDKAFDWIGPRPGQWLAKVLPTWMQ